MIPQIEQRLLARLRAAANAPDALGYDIPTIESRSAPVEPAAIAALPAAAWPGVWVAYLGDSAVERGAGWAFSAVWSVVVGARSENGPETARVGSATEVGSYRLAIDVRALLAEQNLGLEISPLEPGPMAPAFAGIVGDAAISLFSLQFTTVWATEAFGGRFDPTAINAWPNDGSPQGGLADVPETADQVGEGDFRTWHAAYDPPPVTTTTPLPDDARADAVDHVAVSAP